MFTHLHFILTHFPHQSHLFAGIDEENMNYTKICQIVLNVGKFYGMETRSILSRHFLIIFVTAVSVCVCVVVVFVWLSFLIALARSSLP